MSSEDLASENENLKFELNKLNNLYDKVQEQFVYLLNFGELAVFECDKEYKIISSYGAVDPIFRNLNKAYGKNKNLIDMLNNCINFIDENDLESEDFSEHFYTTDVKNILMTFISDSKKNLDLDLFGKLASDELYVLNIKLLKLEFSVNAYIRFNPSSFFLQKYEQKIKSDIESKDLLLVNIFNSISLGLTLLDARNRIILMNQKAKDHHISDEAKMLKTAQLEGRIYRDIFTNETNEELTERQRHQDRAYSSHNKVKFSQKTNGKLVHFEINPLLNENKLPNGLLIITSLEAVGENNSDLKLTKITQLAKHLKGELDNTSERVKELELNQNWLMKKNDQAQTNNKLLHESLKQIYSYLELFPFPIAILEIPSAKYQFVNNAFTKFVNFDRKSILSKMDDQIFNEELAKNLMERTAESINTGNMLIFPMLGGTCKQYLIKSNNESHLLRIFNID
ncbi:MAG TPA: hypothetical protein PLE30_05235 [Candidatus Kapabacteria bacterium]|nr:hypothetical protein [Candidatus Kapabacteria bacterium]